MAVSETFQARRAALLLHGLPRSKREQVMSRLEAAEVIRLKPLLAELAALGLTSVQARQMQLSQTPAVTEEPGSALEHAQSLDVDTVVRAVESCSVATLAQLLRAAEWPWKTELMERLSVERRAAVLRQLAADAPPLVPAVLEAFCRRLCVEARFPGTVR